MICNEFLIMTELAGFYCSVPNVENLFLAWTIDDVIDD